MLNAQNRFDLAIKKKHEIIFHARTTLVTFHSKYKRFFKQEFVHKKPFKTSLLAAAIVWSLNRHLVETLTDISTHDNRSHYLPSWTTHLSVYPGILLLFITVPLQSFRSQAMKTMFVRVSLSVCKSSTLVVAGQRSKKPIVVRPDVMVPVKCEHCCSSGKPGFERNIPANKSANIKMYFFRQVGSIIVNVITQSKMTYFLPARRRWCSRCWWQGFESRY